MIQINTKLDYTNWEVKPQYDSRDFLFKDFIPSQPLITTDNSTHFHTINSQLNGSCVGEATANNAFYSTDTFCSGEAIYLKAKQYDEFPNQEGSSLLAGAKALHKHGAPRKELYPQQPANTPYTEYPEYSAECEADALTRKSDGYFRITSIAEYSQALAQHGAVTLALLWTTGYDHPEIDAAGNAWLKIPEGGLRGGHAVLGCACYPDLVHTFQDGTTIKGFGKFVNSHGYKYGRNGVTYFPLEIIETGTIEPNIPYLMDARVNIMNYTSDLKVIPTDVASFLMADRTFLPLRAIAEALNCEVNYNHLHKTIDIKRGINSIQLQLDSLIAKVNGEKISMDVAPFLATISGGGRTMLPLRYVSEFLGARVDWHAGRIEIQDGTNNLITFVNDKYLVKRKIK